MNQWLIVPRDPLIFRDGKPFTATPGERSKSLAFPFPSTLAGAVRTRLGPDPVNGYDENRILFLKKITVRGPALVELDEAGEVSKWFFPAPADALLIESNHKGKVSRKALSPLILLPDVITDLHEFVVVGTAERVEEKPFSDSPRYWNWKSMEAWLEKAEDDLVVPETLGLKDLVREHRVHVSIEPGLLVSREGALFQTSGMEFIHAEVDADDRIEQAHSLALYLETEAGFKEGVDSLGGERRMVHWKKSGKSLPGCPTKVKDKIIAQKHCRVMLATPALFEKGFVPSVYLQQFGADVKAVVVSRYQTISGWDYSKPKGGEPKPTRRLAPAGSVYFLNLTNVKDIGEFVDAVWLHAVSDDDQARRDGFGLALLGAWDGKSRNMEVKS